MCIVHCPIMYLHNVPPPLSVPLYFSLVRTVPSVSDGANVRERNLDIEHPTSLTAACLPAWLAVSPHLIPAQAQGCPPRSRGLFRGVPSP